MSFNPIYKATPTTLLENQRTTGVADAQGRLLVSTGGAGGGSVTINGADGSTPSSLANPLPVQSSSGITATASFAPAVG